MKLHDHATRREFVAASLRSAMALIAAGTLPARRDDAPWRTRAYPFTLGVASGDPAPDGGVLWTRLAPDPLRGGGMPPRPVPLRWEIAHDDAFRRLVRRGDVRALPELAHAAHVEVHGLQPAREYFYRFISGGETSPVGRLVTAPAPNVRRDLRFAIVSCQHYEDGYYTAFRHLAAERPDFIVHLGDYIYEYGIAKDGPNVVRRHDGDEIVTLEQYRSRYALYKSDHDLQTAHAMAPFIVTWDDHEVDNNYAGVIAEDAAPPEAFALRRVAAYQAYYEHMPLRRSSMPAPGGMHLYRRLHFGALASINVLDTRQYRSDQACGDGRKPRCAEVHAANRTLLGAAQERWLLDGLQASTSRWNFLANQVVLGDNAFQRPNEPEVTYALDTWNGYLAQRQRVLDFLATGRASNPVVLTGDIHVSLALELRADWNNARAPNVGVEFVGTSISSGRDGQAMTDGGRIILAHNPHMKFFDGRRGYVSFALTADRLRASYRAVPFVTRLGAPVETAATFVVESGNPVLQKG